MRRPPPLGIIDGRALCSEVSERRAKGAVMAVTQRGTTPSAEPSRRQVLALALALTATVLTGGAAIAGLTRTPSAAPPAGPAVGQVQTVPPATTSREPVEPGG
jgi:hypothetical protein